MVNEHTTVTDNDFCTLAHNQLRLTSSDIVPSTARSESCPYMWPPTQRLSDSPPSTTILSPNSDTCGRQTLKGKGPHSPFAPSNSGFVLLAWGNGDSDELVPLFDE